MDSAQEQTVANGLRDGHVEAWRTLYEAYAQRIWHYVARLMAAGSADVDDVVQETFLAAARSARHYDPARGSLWFWLGGIARNHVALYFRKRRQHDPIARGEDHVAGPIRLWLDGREDTPGEALASAELVGMVRATLSELPVDYETLLSAKYFDGVSIQQIATARNTSATAVNSKLARARKAFRRAWRKGAPS